MRLAFPMTVLAFNAAALAQDINFLDWVPPRPGDLRSPCPALNSLANHRLIPHNGRNITSSLLVDVLGKVFNVSPEMSAILASFGLLVGGPNATSFDLADLNVHNVVEHDASLSRADFYFSGPEGVAKFDQSTFDRFFSHFHGMEYITMEAAAAARYGQVRYSRAHNPEFTYETQQQATSYAETILYMSAMVDSTGLPKTEFVRILFEEERLPFREGWRPPTAQLNGLAFTQGVMEQALATPEKSVWCGGWGKKPTGQTTFDVPGCFGSYKGAPPGHHDL